VHNYPLAAIRRHSRLANPVPLTGPCTSDKSIAAPNRCFGLHQSIVVLRIEATPRVEFLFAFGEKPGATRTSDATQTVGNSWARRITTCAPRRSYYALISKLTTYV
jgi:hypothetical protein